jgi:hypothetical protein
MSTVTMKTSIWNLAHCLTYRSQLKHLVVCLLVVLASNATASGNKPEYNQRATATAQVLAGIVPAPGDAAIDRLVRSDAFAEHQKWMSEHWSRVKRRIDAMERWRHAEIKLANTAGKTMLYPFSGPDFLNADALFPSYSRYLFFSLERPGSLPDLESLTPDQFAELLGNVRSAFRDIFQRNYFITDYMEKQLRTPWIRGTVPVIATMMALLDLRIVRIEPLDLFPELTRAYRRSHAKRPRRIMRAVKIDFVDRKRENVKSLYYVSVDATDRALEFYPDFLGWVAQARPVSVLLKSASYLLQDRQFAKTREMILTTADAVIQDDTGLPYRYLKKSPWHVKLYGRYNKPIKGLRYAYQADLERAYQSQPDLPQLPFPFGYHWRGKKSCLLYATR